MTPGAFRANAPDIDVGAMEFDLSRIPAVGSARVVLDEGGQLREIHVVCDVGRSAKLVGRDVQSLIAARWGIDVDHRKVSVVQVEGDDSPATDAVVDLDSPAPDAVVAPDMPAPDAPSAPKARKAPAGVAPGPDSLRLEVRSLALSVTSDRAEATVGVAMGDRTASAFAEGLPSSSSQRRLVVTATFDAMAQLDTLLAEATVGEVVGIRVGSDDIVVVILNLWRHGVETSVAGVAVVGTRGELHAAGDAVINAAANLR